MMLQADRATMSANVSIHTSFRCLKFLAVARRPFSFAVEDPDGEVVDAVRLEPWQASLTTIPTERQNLLLLVRVLLCLLQAALTPVVNLEETHKEFIRCQPDVHYYFIINMARTSYTQR